MNVTRTEEWVLREYDREKWAHVRDLIIKAGEDGETSLSRIHRIICRDWLAWCFEKTGETWGATPNVKPICLEGAEFEMAFELGVGGWFSMVNDILVRHSTEADLVVEMGSGWGRILLDLWLGGGPRQALYVGAEYTPTGRACTELLVATEPSLQARAIPFDYHNADLSSLPRAKKSVVFSHHSLEQIPEMKLSVIESALDTADQVTGLHFEPVGFQYGGGSDQYAVKNDYNQNFRSVVEAAEQKGLITIEQTNVDAFGFALKNPATIVVWKKR
jgi:hypothetical protein